jgi:hypothetical protein
MHFCGYKLNAFQIANGVILHDYCPRVADSKGSRYD